MILFEFRTRQRSKDICWAANVKTVSTVYPFKGRFLYNFIQHIRVEQNEKIIREFISRRVDSSKSFRTTKFMVTKYGHCRARFKGFSDRLFCVCFSSLCRYRLLCLHTCKWVGYFQCEKAHYDKPQNAPKQIKNSTKYKFEEHIANNSLSKCKWKRSFYSWVWVSICWSNCKKNSVWHQTVIFSMWTDLFRNEF